MKRLLTLAALGAGLVSLAPLSLARPAVIVADDDAKAEQRWFADFDAAVEVAKKEGKDLLVDFTGSDWCGWCIRLHKEVFVHDAFYGEASKNFVLVALDFPRKQELKDKVPNPERNEELQEKYGIQGFPTILLMNVEGEVFGKTGYRDGGPEKYVEHLAELTKSGKAMVAAAKRLVAAYESATDKVAIVREATKLLGEGTEGAAGADVIASVVRKAHELDPKNEKGLLKDALLALFKAGVAEGADFEAAMTLDPKNEAGLMEQAVLGRFNLVQDEESATAAVNGLLALVAIGKFQDKEALARPTYNAILWCKNAELLNRPDDAKTLFTFAESLGEVPKNVRDAMQG